ncbi:hypothetical protein HYQ45_000012 [Verticillium longisporum]|uniref:Chitin-binding type-2 domain-containing protein n=1 Tax=Verticillium longisporum TaxID=100787 RepID=A0A8I3A1Y8_VERLO|nr:Chromosome-associated kinesin KIF4B [Verticillium dahliae VDG1]KAG7143736.1 hypothetical protein HYQ45_000012 [Verticillium longisporum]RBQ91964.1 hypothetical protein VDGD_00845 [Verticillium dahliae]
MHLQSTLAFLLTLAVATPALAQCRGAMTKTEIKCLSETIDGKCDESRLTNRCPAGQRTNWQFIRNRCDVIGVCEYQYNCCARS